jgi:hypothetical protein
MKTLLALFFAVASLSLAQGQSYSINWYKIAGGGGASASAMYQVSATIGQPDASAAMNGGNFSVTGGFWSLINLVQTPGAPLLTITQVNNQVVISWPSSVTGFLLQTNNNLASGNWGNYTNAVANNSVTNPVVSGNLFFRLKQ